ncbi:MAG: NAD(P)/FAD-dependent oxidoreductase [Saccharospirillaceae bacterium]|nr:FAD-dependent oxidoreductase [Pseudomonadales bacterium]NRB81483.1 NAD(P)/FAD-dependent oxidoreductase [Saccharospirillaceae bacterium]
MSTQQKLKTQLVVIGNGMVTGRFLDELVALDPEQFDITVISAEGFGSYNRIMLSSILAKKATVASIIQKDEAWYQSNDIGLKLGLSALKIDTEHKQVLLSDQSIISYDHLVIATGSRASKIPAKNLHLEHVIFFRTINDTHLILNQCANTQRALVIGGGLLGLEAAYGLAQQGVKVTLLHRSGWLLNRQLDEKSGKMLQDIMQNMDIEFRLKDEVVSFNGEQSLESVTFKSGDTENFDMAIIATGITPNSEIGLDAGLEGNRAILVDDYMQTSDDHISAIGECIEHDGQTFGLVDPLWRQAKTLALRIVKDEKQAFIQQEVATKLKVSGVQLYSAGQVETKYNNLLCIEDQSAGVYRKLIIKSNKIVGIVLFGDVSSGPFYFDLMQQQQDVSKLLPNLIFGEQAVSVEDK